MVLEVQEVRIRLEFRVLLRDHVDAGHQAGQHAFSGSDSGHVPLRQRASGGLASLGELLEDFTLVRGVSLHGVDEVGDHVVALLQQHVDVGPGLFDVLFESDQTVPRRHEPNQHNSSDDATNDEFHHG